MDEFKARFFGLEREKFKPSVVFIDEESPLNPYVRHGELLRFLDMGGVGAGNIDPVSDEGYHHNEQRQRETGEMFVDCFQLGQRGDVLDVGWGANKFVAEGIAGKAKLQVSLIDFNSGGMAAEKGRVVEALPLDGKFRRYVGDFEYVSRNDSVLKNRKFGTIIFNGSWAAGGYNLSVQELIDGKYVDTLGGQQPDWSSEEYARFMGFHLTEMIKQARAHLTPKGVLILASSRYAYHGAGYSFGQLPVEKFEFLDIIERARKLGGKKITLLGVSSEGVRSMYDYNLTDPNMQKIRERQILSKLYIGTFNSPRYSLSRGGVKMSADELPIYSKMMIGGGGWWLLTGR